MKLIGVLLIIAAAIFAIFETNHFGNNLLSTTPSELACDVIALVVCFIGIVFIRLDKK